MKKLFMVHLGGKAEGALIEVHDVQFIIAKSIDECIEVLRKHWYGIDLKLHIDSYKVLENIDGYRLELKENVEDTKCFFIHLGAYSKDLMEEIHRFEFLVGEDINEVKTKASSVFGNLLQEHVDSILDLNQSPLLNKLYSGHVCVVKADVKKDLTPDWQGYRRIDV